MQIFVITLFGTPKPINIEPGDTIEFLKLKIQSEVGIHTKHQRLIFNYQELQDNMKISHYNINEKKLINIVLK